MGKVVDEGEKGKHGVCKIITEKSCGDTCLFSNLPIMAGLYEIQGKHGVYYEVLVKKMDGIIAIGGFISQSHHTHIRTLLTLYQDLHADHTPIGDSQVGIGPL